MNEITVDLGDRAYPIYIGDNLLANIGEMVQGNASDQILVVTNTVVAPLYLQKLKDALTVGKVESVIIEDGEQYKTTETHHNIITRLLQYRFDRSCTLIALGGGVVGDITGFVASTYQRGVGYIQIPTTLLAQVDSAVGGKTAVNHELGKNMIGTFYQPRMVVADTATLKTLPDREYRAGLAEVVKYGCICDAEFFSWLEQNVSSINQRDPSALAYIIERSCMNKADIVSRDEKESGVRALLNLGHTFGHAIETAQEYRDWLHGEAVAAGIIMAADMSERCGMLDVDSKERIIRLLGGFELPVSLPQNISGQQLRELMTLDKKSKQGKMHLILLQGIGNAVIDSEFDHNTLMETITSYTG